LDFGIYPISYHKNFQIANKSIEKNKKICYTFKKVDFHSQKYDRSIGMPSKNTKKENTKFDKNTTKYVRKIKLIRHTIAKNHSCDIIKEKIDNNFREVFYGRWWRWW
jgi:hypothetical protein